MIPDLTLAYVAGLFDGEGSIVIGCSKRTLTSGNPTAHYWLQVGITNTDRELIDWLHITFGGHISDNSHSPSRKRMRPCWAWRVMSREAKAFLESITPYLRSKKAQAAIAIDFQQLITAHGSNSRNYTAEAIALRESYRQRLRSLTLGQHSLPSVE
ncbi:MAG: hypothetical protein AVDCRST_MAG26-3369 [uncultured Chloroflexia bacterium]|uniref:Homing endonuclease LAGLIDADG domain-containing protein n=1 Tax=uncultured Chloroflexia bacterium TaxID=1672391 RepID=A0A6J4JKK8_9CHLR|nr:MAG: hypothetical protein AVDCRST_MAG26-3369 [uncultured Chloroflexia bacterium]